MEMCRKVALHILIFFKKRMEIIVLLYSFFQERPFWIILFKKVKRVTLLVCMLKMDYLVLDRSAAASKPE